MIEWWHMKHDRCNQTVGFRIIDQDETDWSNNTDVLKWNQTVSITNTLINDDATNDINMIRYLQIGEQTWDRNSMIGGTYQINKQ